MRRIEFSRRREEASCGVRNELLNQWSRVRISARHHRIISCPDRPGHHSRPAPIDVARSPNRTCDLPDEGGEHIACQISPILLSECYTGAAQ
jgi:hypothetical protein